jgi:hypothetical protein
MDSIGDYSNRHCANDNILTTKTMELFGLKDKDGKEYKLVRDIENFYCRDTNAIHLPQWEPVLIEPKPEFKVGDWASDGLLVFGRVIGTGYDGGIVYVQDIFTKTEYTLSGSFATHMSPQEVESHLRKICDEKYIGKRAKCTVCSDDVLEIEEFYEYRGGSPLWEGTDQMVYTATNGKLMSVYSDGKFAEVLPQESKELPKTIEELSNLLCKFVTRQESINRLDITINDFLKEQGYKVD